MSAPDEKAMLELVDAVRLFARRHEDALVSGEPPRALEAVDGLHQGLASTLAVEAGALHNALVELGRTPARTPGRLAEGLSRLSSGDAFEREAWAYTALAKRVAECEGALLHLRLTLSKGTADGPALSVWARRVATQTTTVARTMAAVLVVLEAWSGAWRAALATFEGRAPSVGAPAARSARDALRAARECLLSGVPEGAAPPLRAALASGLAEPVLGRERPRDLAGVLSAWREAGVELPAPEVDLLAADHVLAQGTADNILAWRLLDFVESTVQRAGMTRMPSRA